MIKSMTGYGGGAVSDASLELNIELKSVNNRYLDVSIRLPRAYMFAEESIKTAVGRHISRGKVDVFVNVTIPGGDTKICVNEALAGQYADALKRLSELCKTAGSFTPLDIARFPDVLTAEKKELDRDYIAQGIMSALNEALISFDQMRTREGGALSSDVSGRLSRIEELVSFIELRSPQIVSEYREKLRQRMSEVLEDKNIDESRLLTEAAIFADKSAVDEESVRIRSHIAQMRDMIAGESPIGRKLDFLVQEMNREINTIGSKCGDLEITRHVVELKSELEKIREQIQNVE